MIWWLSVHILTLVAAARLTRLVTTDTVTNELRQLTARLLTPRPPHPIRRWRIYLVELINCDWCVGFWASLAAFAITEHYQPTPTIPAWLAIGTWALASSYVIGRTAERLDADHHA